MNEQAVLMVVDVQIDFCPGGSLAIPGGDTIIPVINRYIELFHKAGVPVFATRDWHPPETTHFKQFGGLWPPHCVQGSAGACFHPALRLPADGIIFSKGIDPLKDDYSAFRTSLESGLPLTEHLKKIDVTQVYICGLATDYCVRWTALDAIQAGFKVTVLEDAVKGVDLKPLDSAQALEEIVVAGGKLADLADIERKLSPKPD